MTHVRHAELSLREPADGDHAAPDCELVDERARRGDLDPRRQAIRLRLSLPVRVRRHEVPEQHVAGDPELVERPVDDGGADLCRACAAQLPLGRERDPRHAGTPIPGGLADQQEAGVATSREVLREPAPPKRRLRVLVVRLADSRGREALDKRENRAVAPTRAHVVVHGHVHGVFFRDSVRRLAEQHGVAGWVRNTWDGTVEAVFEGEPSAVEALVTFCEQGPRGAAVERVDLRDEAPEGLTGFRVTA